MEYISVQEVSDKWNISKRRIQILCREGRIKGAKMIGNMWVIPDKTDRPIDGRTKNPVIREENSYFNVRRDLKKLLKAMYRRCEELEILEETMKSYVITILAGSLCIHLLKPTEDIDKIYLQIYKDLNGNKEKIAIDKEMVFLVNQFLAKFEADSEIDNIVSWAYQYSNKIISSNDYSQTQFFTEKYMIEYLVENISDISKAKKIVDPCSGGGNFLVECYEKLCDESTGTNIQKKVINSARKLYGYDIDAEITKIAVVNIRIRALAILKKYNNKTSFEIWDEINPNIFCSNEKDIVAGSLAKDNRLVSNVITGELVEQNEAIGNADIIFTNPPFATIKGMQQEQKEYLKNNYPLSNCDTCVSFLEAINYMLAPNGQCGIVSQNSWMHLKTFKRVRSQFVSEYKFNNIVNLGSGAFYDLSGEKSNVALIIFEKKNSKKKSNDEIKVLNLTTELITDKTKLLKADNKEYIYLSQNSIDGVNGFDFSKNSTKKKIEENKELYKDIAVPMQGTSTGNAKELVDYFWKHFLDKDWIPVSNGGGYCRWEGLNDSVVKWGEDGEYIKKQKGSALRNVRYFDLTKMVFSDTGTAGLNVRILLDGQIFIASGPGIRVTKGNMYAHLAFLNSRLAANYVRTISPKLTIAAGYIGQLPIIDSIYTSVVLEKNAKLCIELKESSLKYRPNCIEYSDEYIQQKMGDIKSAAWDMFKSDLKNELLKLEIESQSDKYILDEYGFSDEEISQLGKQVGECAFTIKKIQDVEIKKLDMYIDKLLDDACMLKRSRISKNTLGCDGVLEFASKDLYISPEHIVKKIIDCPYEMSRTLAKYEDMLIHNTILKMFGYNTKSGFNKKSLKIDNVTKQLDKIFEKSFDAKKWIEVKYNKVHTSLFKGAPCLLAENGEIHTI